MIRFVEKPHLPQGRVCRLILGEKYKKVLSNSLLERNIAPIWLKSNEYVDERLSGHCDLMAIHLGGNVLAVQADATQICELINNIELIQTAPPIRPEYPYDAGLNICIAGDKLIYNPKSADPKIISRLNGTKLCCRQGYTKCSVVPVTESAIITDDVSIASASEKSGLAVLLVSKGDVILPGREYGFIGGCCGLIAPDTMLFNGSLASHKDSEKIRAFLSSFGVRAEEAGDFQLTDIGSILPLAER